MLASVCVQAMRYPVYEGLDIAVTALSGSITKDHGLGGKRSARISLLASLL